MRNFLFVILLITFLTNIVTATAIARRGRLGLCFSIIIYCVAFWNLTLIVFFFFTPWTMEILSLQSLYFWAKLALVGPIIIPSVYLFFALEQTGHHAKENYLYYLIFLPAFILLVFVPSKYNWGFIYFTQNGVPTSEGSDIGLYLPFTIYFLSYLVAAFWILIKNLKNLSEKIATQIRYVLFGSIATAVIAITTNSILPMIKGDFTSQIIGPSASIIFSLSVTYAILKHRFMDIRVVINKSVVYLLLTAIFGGLTVFFAMLLGNRVSEQFSTNILFSAGVVAVVIALAFPLLYAIIQFVVDKIIWRPNANYPKMLMVAEYALARCETVYGLAQETQETIRESLHADSTLFVLNKFTHFFESGTPSARPLTRSQTNTLITFFRESDDFVLADEIERLAQKHPYAQNLLAEIKRFLESRHIAVIIPLKGDGGLLIGFLAVAERANGWYAREDVAFLRSFGEQLVTRFNIVVNDEQATKRMMHILKTMNK